MRYEDAVASLYQVPLDQFVAERKRLADALKAAGDKAGAAALAKRARPPISAWVVDQLWWQARPAFEALFATAQALRDGKLDAMAPHREAIARLRSQAAKILISAAHGATEATLRKVTQTLAALAATGSWDPDPPGALSLDRDPPGFEAAGIAALEATPAPASAPAAAPAPAERPAERLADEVARQAAEAERRREHDEAAARAEAAAEQRRAEAARAKATAERHRLEAALRTARGDLAQRECEVAELERDLATARERVAQAAAVAAGLAELLAQRDN